MCFKYTFFFENGINVRTVYGFIFFHVDKMRAIATAYIVKINELNKHNWNCVGSFAYAARLLSR